MIIRPADLIFDGCGPRVNFSGIRVRPIGRCLIEVSWELSMFSESSSNVGWFVERSENQVDGFVPVSPILSDTNVYIDDLVNTMNNLRDWYYRVSAVFINKNKPGFLKSTRSSDQIMPTAAREDIFSGRDCGGTPRGCYGQSPYMDPRISSADKIRRFYDAGRSGYTKPCTIHQRKTFGKRCMRCWDPVLERIIKSNCDLCKGTGIVDGFYAPIGPINVRFESSSKSKSYTIWGADNIVGSTQARIPNFPKVNPRDIIIENASGRVWLVEAPVNYVGEEILVQQLVMLSNIDNDDIRHDLKRIRPVIPTLAVSGGFRTEDILPEAIMELPKSCQNKKKKEEC